MIRRVVLLVSLVASGASAQARAPRRTTVPEVRLDAFVGDAVGAQVGGGIAIDAGNYLRFAIVAGIGAERRDDDVIVGTQRLEGIARFHVDPYRQSGRGLYFGGGVGARYAAQGKVRPTLIALVGVEGRPRGGVATALEAGVGGGVRLGLAFRRARRDRR